MPALLAFALCLINLLWIAWRFNETLSARARAEAIEPRLRNPIAAILGLEDPAVRRTNLVAFVFSIAFVAMESALTFLGSARFGYTARENGLLLGFLEDAAYTAREEPLVPGDRLLLYTDGLFEAENAAEEPYGLERVMNSLGASAGLPAPVAAEAVVKAMNDWSNRPALDDLTLVLLDRGQTMV